MISYRELIGFAWQFMRRQKWVFILILFLDAFTWPLDVLLWPYILHVVIDIFSNYEGNRMAAWAALKSPIIGGLCLVISVETAARTMGFLMAKAVPKLQADIRILILRLFPLYHGKILIDNQEIAEVTLESLTAPDCLDSSRSCPVS